jgi:hypothetical protein
VSSASTGRWLSPAKAARSSLFGWRHARRGRSNWLSASAATGLSSWPPAAGGWTGTAPHGSSAGPRTARGSPSRWGPHAEACVHHCGARCRGAAAGCAGSRLARRSPNHDEVRPRPRQPGPPRDLRRRRLSRWRCPVRTGHLTGSPPGRSAAARRRRAAERPADTSAAEPGMIRIALANRRSVLEPSVRSGPLEARRMGRSGRPVSADRWLGAALLVSPGAGAFWYLPCEDHCCCWQLGFRLLGWRRVLRVGR